MMRILPALVALCQGHYLLAYEQSTTTARQINTDEENSNTVNKSLEFVHIIRDDLRRNNDDYEVLEGQNQLSDFAHPAKSRHPVHPAHPAHPVHPLHPAYPVLPGHPTPRQPYRSTISPPVPRLQPAQPFPSRAASPAARGYKFSAWPAHSPARAAPLRRFDTRTPTTTINPNQFRSYTRSKQYKNQRQNKLKRLLNKDNINMRQEDLVEAEDQPEEGDQPQAEGQPGAEDTTTASPPATEPATQSAPPPTTHEHTPPPSPLTHTPTTRRHSFRPLQEGREQSPVLRNSKDSSPSPEQLDMAAARNPEITRIRIKVLLTFNPYPPKSGRLCQRSLMNAEGPTYDRNGKLLEPAHRPKSARGRKFHQTRAPSLLLPRCCNCCKKSVLGCQ